MVVQLVPGPVQQMGGDVLHGVRLLQPAPESGAGGGRTVKLLLQLLLLVLLMLLLVLLLVVHAHVGGRGPLSLVRRAGLEQQRRDIVLEPG